MSRYDDTLLNRAENVAIPVVEARPSTARPETQPRRRQRGYRCRPYHQEPAKVRKEASLSQYWNTAILLVPTSSLLALLYSVMQLQVQALAAERWSQ